MHCPVCQTRRGKRPCPALGRSICPTCCGTKRLVEIQCPPDCSFLARASEHPPAVVRKQRDRDVRFAAAHFEGLTDTGRQLLLTLQLTVARHRKAAIPPLVDSDIVDACAALAATLETLGRGIIYEHQPTSRTAQRLLDDLRAAIAAGRRSVPPEVERAAAEALRRIEQGARAAATYFGETPTAYLDFLTRLPALLRPRSDAGPDPGQALESGSTGPSEGEERPRIVLG